MGTNWAARGLPADLDERQQAYRELILDAAEIEFSLCDFTDVKINRIARRAGLSDATIRRHFTGKVGLWNGLHNAREAELLDNVRSHVGASTDPVERILSGVRAVVDFFARRPGFLELQRVAGLSWSGTERRPLSRGEQLQAWSNGRDMLHLGILDAVRAGRIDPRRPELTTALILSALQVWLLDAPDPKWPQSASVVAEDLCRHLSGHVFETPRVGAAPRSGDGHQARPHLPEPERRE